MTPNDALLIFRLVKSVGRLPNVMYLLVFDRELAEKAVKERYPSEGPHFLEKIIQASFELPLPARDDLNTAALSLIESICGPIEDRDILRRFMNLFYDAISPFINTPRDITRLSNSMTVSWPAVAKEVDIGDYVVLEVMKLFEPSLYNAIRTKKESVCGTKDEYGRREDPEQEIKKFLDLAQKKHREHARLALIRLFPRFENVQYSSSSIVRWEVQRLVCTSKHFDTYFRMGIGDETLSIAEINELIENTDNKEYVKEAFLKAFGSIRKNGRSKVPLLLDELNAHASKIEKTKFQTLISALFEIVDDIYRDEDSERGGFSIGNTHLRIHWLIRKLTLDRCDLNERSEIFWNACQNAQVGWLVDFANSVVTDHFPREGREPEPEKKCLMTKDYVPELKAHSLSIIESAAKTGKLILHPQLPYILFRWIEFSENDDSKVKFWIKEQLDSDESVAILAQAFTFESWSQGIGMDGLGDRVSMRKIKAGVESIEKIVEIDEFRRRLEEVEKNETLDKELKKGASVFLEAWRKQERGNDC